ncbi:MAG: VOC family protein [Chloroflexi bacterium]|nr:VOC family protein [Chloroflexota bacterium]MBI3741436.1 VOC family protein [Chloroflexota bacterium]
MVTKKPKAKRAAPKPKAPAAWSPEIRGLNVVWYYVSDWARAKKFYGETLGLPTQFVADEVGWCEFGNHDLPHLAISKWVDANPLPAQTGGAIATFTCDDVRAARARLIAKGVSCEEIDEIPGFVRLCTFRDPDGNRLQLAESLAPM